MQKRNGATISPGIALVFHAPLSVSVVKIFVGGHIWLNNHTESIMHGDVMIAHMSLPPSKIFGRRHEPN